MEMTVIRFISCAILTLSFIAVPASAAQLKSTTPRTVAESALSPDFDKFAGRLAPYHKALHTD
jgi:hypothetical protein